PPPLSLTYLSFYLKHPPPTDLYTLSLHDALPILAELLAELPVAPDDYTLAVVAGVEEHRDELDTLIRKFADRWSLERMPIIDRKDRKSTRLNSSHRTISYAVFCLKKKNGRGKRC